MSIRRFSWRFAYPFCRILHRFGLSYKFVNIGIAAWNRESFNPLWHHKYFGDEITNMPESVNLCGILYHVAVSEGLVKFSSRDTWSFISFTRDPFAMEFLWYVELVGRVPASHVERAYEWIKAVYGGSFELKRPAIRGTTKGEGKS